MGLSFGWRSVHSSRNTGLFSCLKCHVFSEPHSARTAQPDDSVAASPTVRQEPRAKLPRYQHCSRRRNTLPFTVCVDCSNQVEIVELNTDTGSFVSTASFDHPYPTTKIQWIPDANGSHPDLLGTTVSVFPLVSSHGLILQGDYLRLWEVRGEGVIPHKLYHNVRCTHQQLLVSLQFSTGNLKSSALLLIHVTPVAAGCSELLSVTPQAHHCCCAEPSFRILRTVDVLRLEPNGPHNDLYSLD